MKSVFGLLSALLVIVPVSIFAQDASPAVVAAQQDAEERYKRLTATVEELIAAQAAQQRRLNTLADELRALREEMTRANAGAVSAETVRRLADQVQKVDNDRVADNKRVLEELAKLGKTLTVPPPTPPPARTPPAAAPATTSGTMEGFEYVVQRGDVLSTIVQAYREQGIKVTQRMVEEANPGVNWNRLRVGQKVFIPRPKP